MHVLLVYQDSGQCLIGQCGQRLMEVQRDNMQFEMQPQIVSFLSDAVPRSGGAGRKLAAGNSKFHTHGHELQLVAGSCRTKLHQQHPGHFGSRTAMQRPSRRIKRPTSTEMWCRPSCTPTGTCRVRLKHSVQDSIGWAPGLSAGRSTRSAADRFPLVGGYCMLALRMACPTCSTADTARL